MGVAVPIIMVVVFAYTYYVYVVELCVFKISTVTKRVVYLVFYHLTAINLGVCYFVCICLQSEDIPEEYYFTFSEFEQVNEAETDSSKLQSILQAMCGRRRIHTFTRKNGIIRYCLRCKLIKPDRTHHCSSCQRCILKMDHHCPWLNNCVSFANYKIFILLLVHLFVYCLFYSATTAEYVLEFFLSLQEVDMRQVQYVATCFFLLVSGIASFCLFVYHISLLLNNETTLEAMTPNEYAEDVTFDLGACDNFLEVFGYNWCLWWLPVTSSLGDGVTFPVTYIRANDARTTGVRSVYTGI